MGDLIRQFASVLIEIWRHKKQKNQTLFRNVLSETCYNSKYIEKPEAYSETC